MRNERWAAQNQRFTVRELKQRQRQRQQERQKKEEIGLGLCYFILLIQNSQI